MNAVSRQRVVGGHGVLSFLFVLFPVDGTPHSIARSVPRVDGIVRWKSETRNPKLIEIVTSQGYDFDVANNRSAFPASR